MQHMIRFLCVSVSLLMFSGSLQAGHHGKASNWSLAGDKSKVAYGSVKKNAVGEVNHFKTLSGSLSATGDVEVAIDLASVETFINIRNQRMVKHVFTGDATKATLKASVDMNTLKKLAVGDTTDIDVTGTLGFMGKTVEIDTTMIVAKLSKTRIMVTTDEMIMVKTADLGIDGGVDKLMELAKLNSITRVVPVTLRLVFDASDKQASVSTGKAAKAEKAIASAGDPAVGKKLYRQCQACHNVKSESNGVGPHLVNIMGRKAGAVEGFAYSKPMKASNIVWNAETLKAFMANPANTVPGNTMPFPGMANTDDIDHILAYLGSLQK